MKTDFEYESELEGLYLEQDPLSFFFDKHDLLERIYVMDKRITCKWKPELDNQYFSYFIMRNIQKFQQQLAAIISNMSYATQELIDHLYTNMKSIFIEPAILTCIYREYANNSRNVRNQSRRHGKKVWFNRECELLRKEYMTIKNYLKHVCKLPYQLFHEHVKQYKKVVSKTKKLYTRKFHSDIRKLKTINPREL